MEAGDKVRILPPFDKHFPGTYGVWKTGDGGAVNVEGTDFDPEFVELVKPADDAVLAKIVALEAEKITKATILATIDAAKDSAAAADALAQMFGVKE